MCCCTHLVCNPAHQLLRRHQSVCGAFCLLPAACPARPLQARSLRRLLPHSLTCAPSHLLIFAPSHHLCTITPSHPQEIGINEIKEELSRPAVPTPRPARAEASADGTSSSSSDGEGQQVRGAVLRGRRQGRHAAVACLDGRAGSVLQRCMRAGANLPLPPGCAGRGAVPAGGDDAAEQGHHGISH